MIHGQQMINVHFYNRQHPTSKKCKTAQFQRYFQVLNTRAAISDLNSNDYQFCKPKSNFFNHETSVKRILFFSHFSILGVVYIPIGTLASQERVFGLELRQYKNGLASLKSMLVLKLPPFFPHQHGKEKRAAISKTACLSQKRIRSYIVLALVASNSSHRTRSRI